MKIIDLRFELNNLQSSTIKYSLEKNDLLSHIKRSPIQLYRFHLRFPLLVQLEGTRKRVMVLFLNELKDIQKF
ncbi:hypothetical protein DP113_23600 [Brasilonema octagenarum UFV-E1]|uniref:Uncharacterized protein n=2 Tax=Brasilonema TaxID=383614 RepID=A0A856MMR7_9CYAN|nr:hypothetical protein [Brasilonema octagenarum UFV-OR1]QDL10497.1 hypothetical protein DP114_23695 [Brasilonema sennae CENA114]QDL16843.1 hypothetical protein DP113_23600 [Brasilonema octagenarum UFV-E1]